MTSRKLRHPTKRRSPEAELQRFIVQTLKLFGVDGLIYFHVPNQGKRTKWSGAELKRLGLLPGVPDLAIILPGARIAFLELKSLDGVLSPAQVAFGETCYLAGISWDVVCTPEQATAYLTEIGALRKNPLARAA